MYRAPVDIIAFTLKHSAGFAAAQAEGIYDDLGDDLLEAVLSEAGKFAGDVIAPLNRIGDQRGAVFKDGAVTMPPGWKEAYTRLGRRRLERARRPDRMGRPGPALGGQRRLHRDVELGLRRLHGRADAHHGRDRRPRGPRLATSSSAPISASSSPANGPGPCSSPSRRPAPTSGLLRTRAERHNGAYKITGQKIFITYGEHDLTDNIIHLVLARLPDAPPGTKGISLFLVPKFLVNPDGSLGARNDVRAHSIEHKLGIHASPTCTMVFGDNGGATAYLIGDENRGMACMFTMMNDARLAIGLQGLGIAEARDPAGRRLRTRAQARPRARHAGERDDADHRPPRRQAHVVDHARAHQCGARDLLCDRRRDRPPAPRRRRRRSRKAAHERAALLTPIAKAFSTDIGSEVSSLGVQVHGGMGYIEETGAAQFYRDARIARIYEGTNGIQAIDLVTRKLPLSGGETVRTYINELRATVAEVEASNDPAFGATGRCLGDTVQQLDRATSWLLTKIEREPDTALAGATPYLRLFGLAAGGCALAKDALAALRAGNPGSSVAIARFFATNIANAAAGLAATVIEGADALAVEPDAIG